jgi:hypothetical protein
MGVGGGDAAPNRPPGIGYAAREILDEIIRRRTVAGQRTGVAPEAGNLLCNTSTELSHRAARRLGSFDERDFRMVF